MNSVHVLENTIQTYAWGSLTAIPQLLGTPASQIPQAELWMGAHPKAPSKVQISTGEKVSLSEIIQKNPEKILGKTIAEKFENQLPYLFKVLAAGSPLSIQAHPDQIQAKKGYALENQLKIPLNAPNRNYKDSNHKPECICALTPFWGMNGFRPVLEILDLCSQICPETFRNELEILENKGLKDFFKAVMTLDVKRRSSVIKEALINSKKQYNKNPAFKWVQKLYQAYPSDIGVLSPLFLNLVCLKPGQAMFLPAGQLHAYLDGLGIELMANSDNVLRGGLTPKHIDVPELLKVLRFESTKIELLAPKSVNKSESQYPVNAQEFALSFINLDSKMGAVEFVNSSVEILLCTQGNADLKYPNRSETLEIQKGMSIIVPNTVNSYFLNGNAVFYKAAVPA